MESLSFLELVERVQQGDAEAFERLMQRYGGAIQREIRFALRDTRLRQLVGHSDVFQSVVLRFFAGVRDERFTIRSPQELLRLLKGIARVRIAELARFWSAQRRDLRRTLPLAEAEGLAAVGPQPREQLEQAELLARVRQHLSPQERQLVEWRDDGLSWGEIGERLGDVGGDAARLQHDRALAWAAVAAAGAT